MIDELPELPEFEKIADRGGVLGAMETDYQRSKIQDARSRAQGRKAPSYSAGCS